MKFINQSHSPCSHKAATDEHYKTDWMLRSLLEVRLNPLRQIAR